jgi:SWI/SNF-related matrix-associated actin-dependent regulator 1 of chromatin subfamily A
VTYCQQIVNHPELIGCDGDSEKVDALIDLLTEGELDDEKVIVFSRFRKMIDILVPALRKAKIETVRITGEEDEKARKVAQDAFQDPKSKVRVCAITTAASEAINLQAARAVIFYDTPYSAGDYLQILGRMIRIGSVHDRCYAIHMVAGGTIDERVIEVMRKKMTLVEKVLGKRIKGETDSDTVVAIDNDLSDLFNALRNDAKKRTKP